MYLLKYEPENFNDGITLMVTSNYRQFGDVIEMVKWVHENAKYIKNYEIYKCEKLDNKGSINISSNQPTSMSFRI